MHTFSRGVLWTGLVGTLVFVLVGLWMLVSRVWAQSFTQTLEVLVAAPFLAAWVLSPLLWATRPRREEERSQDDVLVAAIAGGLVVGLAAYAYIPEFFILPIFFDAEPQLASLRIVLMVPGGQWAILGGAAIVRSLQRGRAGVGGS
ncbi:MAG: hypothetical protein OEO79_16540 [Gemmatimonadota bacterium]|nr:hypothetical protein [Gemmatimonadota bacterium]